MATNDILRELSTTEIVNLSKIYSQWKVEAPHIFSYLQTSLSWSEKTPDEKLIQVFVPEGDGWHTNGTFVSVGHFPWKMIVTFTMEESGEELYNALLTTERFDYAQHSYLYYALHEKHMSLVHKAMVNRGLKKVSDDRTDLWKLSQNKAIAMAPSFPSEYTMEPLQVTDSTKVNEVWPHKSQDSEGYVRTLIEMNGGWGIYTTEDNALAAWILKSQLGQLALLQVTDEHQRKGLARALVHMGSKEIAQAGFDVLATIVQTNVASQTLFAQCGFTKEFMCAFIVYK